jgi:hypothetical protein
MGAIAEMYSRNWHYGQRAAIQVVECSGGPTRSRFSGEAQLERGAITYIAAGALSQGARKLEFGVTWVLLRAVGPETEVHAGDDEPRMTLSYSNTTRVSDSHLHRSFKILLQLSDYTESNRISITMATTPTIPASFFEPVLSLPHSEQLRWYSCVIVSLSSLNFPDVILQVYEHLDTHFLSKLSHHDRFDAARRLREALIKSTGIVGAARTGNAIRTLTGLIPEDLRETESPRSQESDEVARARGKTFWTRVYERNKAFDPQATVRASPDYAFVVRGMKSPLLLINSHAYAM